MKPGGDGVLADGMNIGSEPSTAAMEVAVPDGESDDEYEQIPTRKEKLRKLDTPGSAKPTIPSGQLRTPDEADVPAADVATSTESHEGPNVNQTEPGATDDDWLRSRTNRLLDLVEPDDLTKAATPSPEYGSAREGAKEIEQSATVSADPAQEASAQEASAQEASA